jgi:hypothetical protein
METFQKLKVKPEKTKFEKELVLNSQQLRDRLIWLRDGESENSWDVIKRKIDEEFKVKSNVNQLKKIYEKEAAISLKIDGYAKKYLQDYVGLIAKRYERMYKITDRATKAMENYFDLIEVSDPNDIDTQLKMINMIKPLVSLNHAVLAQLAFVREEQEKISMQIQKDNRPSTDEEIRAKTYAFMPEILKIMEINGDIKILNRDVLK